MLNAQEIVEKKFEKAAFGYRTEEVEHYLQEVSTSFNKMQNEKIQLERKLEVLAEKIEEYRADEDSMRAAILDARKLGSSIVQEARAQADQILANADAQSAKVIDSIQMRAEREKMNLSHLQKEVATFKNQLLALYKNHLELISSLPENAQSVPAEAPVQDTAKPAEEPLEETQMTSSEASQDTEEPSENVGAGSERESRFGQLKFGAAYDLKRD